MWVTDKAKTQRLFLFLFQDGFFMQKLEAKEVQIVICRIFH